MKYVKNRYFLSSEAAKTLFSCCRRPNAPSIWMEQLQWMLGIFTKKEKPAPYKKQVDKWFSSLGLTESELVTF